MVTTTLFCYAGVRFEAVVGAVVTDRTRSTWQQVARPVPTTYSYNQPISIRVSAPARGKTKPILLKKREKTKMSEVAEPSRERSRSPEPASGAPSGNGGEHDPAPPAGDAGAPTDGSGAMSGGDGNFGDGGTDEGVKLYVGNLDYGGYSAALCFFK